MKNRRFWALLIALVMIFGIVAACGDGTTTDPAPPTTDDTTAADPPPATTDDTQSAEDGEPYDLTVTWFNTLHMIRPFQDTDVGKAIKEKTGITLEIVSGDMDLFMVLAAGGDLPDVVWLANDDGSIASALFQANQVIPLDDLLAERGQNVLRRNRVGMEMLRDQLAGADSIYFIPTETTELNLDEPNMHPWTGIYARHDLWVEMGAPPVTNEDEFLQMLKDMQDANPVSPVGTKTFALSAWTDWGMWPFFFMYSPMYGWRGSDPFYHHIETEEMRVSFSDPDSVFWDCIEFYFKANQLGIFDPEGLVQDWPTYSSKFRNGELFTGPAMNWEGGPDQSICGPEAILAIIPGAFPHIHDVWPSENPGGWGFSNSRGISTNAEYPGRVMDLFNFLDSDDGARLLISGVEGKHWDWIDGVPTPIGDNLARMLGDTEAEMRVVEEEGVSRLQYYNSGKWVADDGFPTAVGGVQIARMVATENPAYAAFANFHGLPGMYPGEVYAHWVNTGIASSPPEWLRISDYMAAGVPETGQAVSLAGEYIRSNLGNLIMARDRATFEAEKARIIEEIMTNMGMAAAAEEMTRLWNEAVVAAHAANP